MPPSILVFTSAPWANNNSVILLSFLKIESNSGVTSDSALAFTSAPLANNSSIISMLPIAIARMSGVVALSSMRGGRYHNFF